jgi:fucokinase
VDTWLKLRLFHYTGIATGEVSWMDRAFEALYKIMLADSASDLGISADAHISMDRHEVLLPLRVNWAGGCSDVAPYCTEHGGTVLNAAILLNGAFPVRVSLTRLEQRQIVLESTDMGVRQAFDSLAALQRADDSSDPLALHKAALMASGVVPMSTVRGWAPAVFSQPHASKPSTGSWGWIFPRRRSAAARWRRSS